MAVEANAPVKSKPNQRLALIIGNSNYADAPLANPVNDARAMSQALRGLGFTVIARENADFRAMNAAVREFGDQLQAGGVGVFYYAGHGMQIKGSNFLIPVGSNIAREDEVAYGAIDAQAVLDKMDAAGNGNNFMILDACRNNPFIRNTRSGKAGLSQMDAPVGTLVSFATSPGAVASDGVGANGLYTTHLLDALKQPGLKAEEVFKRVRAAVRRDSKGAQVPWEATSLEGDFYFRPPLDMAAAPLTQVSAAPQPATPQSSAPNIIAPQIPSLPPSVPFPGKPPAALPVAVLDNGSPANPKPPSSPLTPEQNQAISAAIDAMVQQRVDAAVAATVPAQSARPPAASNAFGFTVGDTWRFQTVDKWKQEITGNWSRRIDSINPAGQLILNGGNVIWEANGDTRRVMGQEKRLREFATPYKTNTSVLQAGFSESNDLKIRFTLEGAPNGQETQDAKIKVIRQESVTVPAGTFMAWKIERSGYINGVNSTGGNYQRRFTDTYWYVPAIRNFVAAEYESRYSNGSPDTRTRQELTSFAVRGADQALAQLK